MTTELVPPRATGANSLKERLAIQDRRIAETGVFEPELRLKGADPVAFEVLFTKIHQAVINAREVALLISASPATREQGEIIFGLFTPEGDSIALSSGLMIHVHTMSRAIKWMIANDYETAVGINQGDYFFNNDSFIGGGHPSDQMLITPYYVDGEIAGWIGGLTHVVETGAAEPGAMGSSFTSRFVEGLILPCLKVGINDQLTRDAEILVERSVRTAVPWLTDNRAKLTGIKLIRDAMEQLIGEIGADRYHQLSREYIEDTLRASREKVRRFLHPGRYRDVAWRGVSLTGQESLMQAPCELVVTREGRIILDYDGVPSARRQPFQGTLPLFEGMLFNALIQNVFYDLRYNDGTFLAVELHVPEGTACNPTDIFLPTTLWGPAYAGLQALGSCVARAYFANGYLEEAHASGPLTSGNLVGGFDQYGRPVGGQCFEFASSGMYATAFMDGLDSAFSDFNAEGDMGDAEVWEQGMPQVWLAREIRKDGGGFGRYRGGNGIHSLYMAPEGARIEMGSFGSPPIFSTTGIMGGYPAPPLRTYIGRGSNLRSLIESGADLPNGEGLDPAEPAFVKAISADWELVLGQNYPVRELEPGSLFSVVTGDGGGFGDPIEREPLHVARDVANALTSAETAERIYGVRLGPDGSVDAAATKELRSAMRRRRLERGVPAREYKATARERVLAKDFPKPVQAMYRDVIRISRKFATEFRSFWNLPADYEV